MYWQAVESILKFEPLSAAMLYEFSSTAPSVPPAVLVTAMVAGGSAPGMLISIFFPQTPPADLSVGVTLYQKGARHYGTPVLCTANDGC